MLKYNKVIVTLSIIVSFGGKFCHATTSTDKLDDVERGFGNSIQISHQDTLQQEQLNEYDGEECTADNTQASETENEFSVTKNAPSKNKTFYQLGSFFSSTYRNINKNTNHYCSLPIFKEYACQVAASVTSGLILYGIYQGLNILPH